MNPITQLGQEILSGLKEIFKYPRTQLLIPFVHLVQAIFPPNP